jgi:hypothetical protein
MQIVLDFIEILAVFLLAVEAIKLENLSTLTSKLLIPTLDKINPKVTFVETMQDEGFFDQYWFEVTLIGFFLLGLLICYITLSGFGIDVFEWFSNISGLSWLWVVPSMLFVSVLVGFLPYQVVVLAFELSIKSLSWIEKHTSTGVVGIMGFILYLFQFVGRRL